MENKKSPISEAVKQNKDSNFRPLTQEQIVSISLAEKPKTRRQIEAETGVHNNTIDWIVSSLIKSDIAFIERMDKCPITGSEGVQFVTTNNDYRPRPTFIQKTLF